MDSSKRQEPVLDTLSSPTNPAHWFAYTTSLYLLVQSLPLLLFPRLLLILSTPRGAAGQASAASGAAQGSDPVSAIGPDLTPLERYSAYTNAISMLTVAAFVLILTGAVPVTSSPLPDSKSNGASPFRMPTVVIATLYFAVNALTAWSQAGAGAGSEAASGAAGATVDPSQLGIGTYGKAVAVIHALFAFWGFGVFLFGNDLTRNAKKAGDSSARDKSVSNWPFKNQYAAEEKQKKKSS